MKFFKWAYGVFALTGVFFLTISFFMQDVKPLTQISLLIQSVGYGWICGFAIGEDM